MALRTRLTPRHRLLTSRLEVLVNSDTVSSVTLSSDGCAAAATFTSPGPTIRSRLAQRSGTGLGNYIISYDNGNLHDQLRRR